MAMVSVSICGCYHHACIPNRLPPICFQMENKESSNVRGVVETALHAAALRMRATLKPEPLIHDPYAACLVASIPVKEDTGWGFDEYQYELSTKFIDDRLLNAVKQIRQVILLSDGMDTRPYRLAWPPSTMIFDVSSDLSFKLARERLSAIGAKVSKMCLLRHVSAELGDSSELQIWSEQLKAAGYRGDKPSIWALQGLDYLTLHSFQDIVTSVSSLAMKDSIFVGDVPLTAVNTVSEEAGKKQLEKVFLSQGFSIQIFAHEKLAQELGCNQFQTIVDSKRILFVAQQLRLSDDQVAIAIREMELAEEAGDEEGFEDL